MTAYYHRKPIFRIRHDRNGCTTELEAATDSDRSLEKMTRGDAGEAVWNVPLSRGEGSRTGRAATLITRCRALARRRAGP